MPRHTFYFLLTQELTHKVLFLRVKNVWFGPISNIELKVPTAASVFVVLPEVESVSGNTNVSIT